MTPEYREVWLVDFEFQSTDGDCPIPVCMVALEWRSGRILRLWRDQLLTLRTPPFNVTKDALFVAYYASAELGCFLALGWDMPTNVLDLCVEFKLFTSGFEVTCGRSLLGALTSYGIGSSIDQAEKDSMRQLAMRGGEYTDAERLALLDYCQSDVVALNELLPRMLPAVDMPRALLRGRYMAALA